MTKITRPSVPTQKPAASSAGARLGDELRASTNMLSDEKRQELRNFGLALVYGGSSGTKPLPVRR